MAFSVPQMFVSKSNFNPPPAPASASQYWSAEDCGYVSGGFIELTNDLNELSGALTGVRSNVTNLGVSKVLTQNSSSLSGAVDISRLSNNVFFRTTGSADDATTYIGRLQSNSIYNGVEVSQSANSTHAVKVRLEGASGSHIEMETGDDNGVSYAQIFMTRNGVGNSSLEVDDAGLLSVSEMKAASGIYMSGARITGLAPGTGTGHAVEFDQFYSISSSIGQWDSLLFTWPPTVGTTWPHTGSTVVTGGLHPASGSMSACLDQLWGDFYAREAIDINVSSTVGGLVYNNPTGSVPTELFLKSQNYTWRITIGDDGALSSSLVA